MAESRLRRFLVTGGAGFIGSNFARMLLQGGAERVVVFDKITYAGNPANLLDLADYPAYEFVQGDICDPTAVGKALDGCQAIVNFAAESHVDRSLLSASEFIQTNILGTTILLEAAVRLGIERFVQVSTDEVYGDVAQGYSREDDPLRPRSPYSASKASAELMVNAYAETFGLDAIITRGSNTYGPYQFPEKLIPLMITNVFESRPLPVYGDGQQARDWLYVLDHCRGILVAMERGEPGQIYNIGGGNERRNLDVVMTLLDLMDGPPELITHVEDRLGHDRRYALSTERLRALGWRPETSFEQGLRETVDWYRANGNWWRPLKDGRFTTYYQQNYGARARLNLETPDA
ncbi:MAG TPA: dTDP-glucose 4,6-dehydratase [Nitrolancea sp.]